MPDDELCTFNAKGVLRGNFHSPQVCREQNEMLKKRIFSKSLQTSVLILDKSGKVRLLLENAKILCATADNLTNKLEEVMRKYKQDNDLAPQIHIIDETNIIDFSGLTPYEHVINAIKNQLDFTKKTQINAIIKL